MSKKQGGLFKFVAGLGLGVGLGMLLAPKKGEELRKDLKIKFEANEWEQERMIMHCYVEVKFRDIVKRIILEINIQRPDYKNGGES